LRNVLRGGLHLNTVVIQKSFGVKTTEPLL
jgi:hypothetical protein